MSLNIKNVTTVSLVRELAERTNQTQTSAIENAVRAALAELDSKATHGQGAARLDRARAVLAEIDASLTDEDRADLKRAEATMYDNAGLFA
jgi:antitoxin VapB